MLLRYRGKNGTGVGVNQDLKALIAQKGAPSFVSTFSTADNY